MAITLRDISRQNRFQRRMQEAKEREFRDAPIDPEIARRMTKPKEAEPVYQVFVDIKGENGSRPVSPSFAGSAGQESCEQILAAINAQICLGKLTGWGNARVEKAVHVRMN